MHIYIYVDKWVYFIYSKGMTDEERNKWNMKMMEGATAGDFKLVQEALRNGGNRLNTSYQLAKYYGDNAAPEFVERYTDICDLLVKAGAIESDL